MMRVWYWWRTQPKAIRAWGHGALLTLITITALAVILRHMGIRFEAIPPIVYSVIVGMIFFLSSVWVWDGLPESLPERKKKKNEWLIEDETL